MVILGDEARSIDSVLYMEPLFKVGDIMCLKEKTVIGARPFSPRLRPLARAAPSQSNSCVHFYAKPIEVFSFKPI